MKPSRVVQKPRARVMDECWYVSSPGTFTRTGWTLTEAYRRWWYRNVLLQLK
ncbi:hypothetical protein Ep4_004 [Pseudomonas phage Ep4]|uniref:Uncharacterized protein n=1 Tax=Pseudomonas phage Ep4 TaxID=3057492 RepID=A0AAU9E6U5_9CAUD|nr:hypothetical protein Ep4_004 [Pseudomonas phage Ep4]